MFVGHGTLRSRVMGNTDRAPTGAELAEMKAMVTRAMQDGAFGLSSGLEYAPGVYAANGELVELGRAVAPFGGLYISHIRDEGGLLLESVAEVIQVGEEAGIPAQVTHHKVIGKHRWGRSAEALRLIDAARARGVDVSSDQYPYTASSTGLTILFPAWSKEGSRDDMLARLRDPGTRARLKADIVRHLDEERGGDPATVVAASCGWDPALNGKSLADMVRDRGRDVTLENAAEVAMDLQEQGGCQGVFHSMSEEDVQRIMQHPMTMISSDGGIPNPGDGVPHPRNYGSFARVLSRYVRDLGVLTFSEAVRKMAGLSAERLGLANRGVVRVGAVADLAVLDPETITDHATFTDPHQYATGVLHVFVAGQAALLDGEPTGARPGRVLRHTHR
jgi:dihydroorotase/N-acyl-D-amino-acid deacylase